MKKINTPLLLLLISFLFFSCSKEKSVEESNKNQSFIPHTTHATWHYIDTSYETGFTLEATDSTKVIDGITFYYYKNIPDIQPDNITYTLIGNADGNYYLKSFLPQLGEDKILVLKQNAAAGEEWTQPFSTGGTSLNLLFKVKEKDISHKVSGHFYEQVTHIEIGIQLPGNIGSLSLGDVYFARGVGIIQIEMKSPLDDGTAVHLLLTNFKK